MKKNKKLTILVFSLITVIGVSLAYFAVSMLISGTGAGAGGTTATIQGSTVTVEGTLEFNDLDIYPGHQNVSSIRVTATGDNELIPYNVIWEGTNTLNTPLNYTVYKTSSEIEVSATCEQTRGVINGAYMYYEECNISNLDQLGTAIATGTINSNETKVTLAKDEFITSTPSGLTMYYYVILEYPNLDEAQNIDIGGTFTGEVTIEESDTEPDINIIAAYIEQEDGSYEEVSDIPQEGYALNSEKSTCSNGAIPSWQNNGLFVSNLTQSGTSCYLYFDEYTVGASIIANKTIDDSRSGAITGTLTTNTTGTVYSVADDYGTSYVYAGAPTDNWVYFAGYYWRIIRINGDGSIRMIYNGTSTTTTGTTTQIQTSAYNSTRTDNAYVGYMYGSTGASSYSETHTNTNDSTIKGILDQWYEDNIDGTEYEQYISREQGFCNDRVTQSGIWSGYGNLGYGNNATGYAPAGRLISNGSYRSSQNPSLKCSQSNDYFTVNGSSRGNHALDYPIGLITSDEVVLAGGFGGSSNQSYYLYTNKYYWTMSPCLFHTNGYALVSFVDSVGLLSDDYVNNTRGVRPVLNLDASVTLTGNGTTSNPYIVS